MVTPACYVRTMLNTLYMDIPDDIVIEILSRLPAKSLLRLRWACKYWFDLITRDRAFIKKNYLLYHHTTINSNDHDRIINNTSFVLYDDAPYLPVVYTMNLGDLINNHNDADDVGTLVNMDGCNLNRLVCNNFSDYCYIGFGGSCNGLILLIFYRKMSLGRLIGNNTYFLWNPCTREFKELPCEPTNIRVVEGSHNIDHNIGYHVLGFGYDQINDDYKVLRINISYSTTSQLLLNNDNNAAASAIDNLNMEIGIYTLGSNSWSTKILADPLVKAHWKKVGVLGLFHNGALHWIRQLEQGTLTIISFDITKEELRDIEVPNFITQLHSLKVLNGCLCIFQMKEKEKSHDITYDIWIMKDYGVKDSWTKLFNINMEKAWVDTRSRPYYSLDQPVNQYLKDGGILMLTNRKVIAVCDSKKKDKAGFIYSIRDYEGFVVATYIESLVSLNSGKYSTLVGSKTTTVTKQDLLEYEVVDGFLVKISQEQN